MFVGCVCLSQVAARSFDLSVVCRSLGGEAGREYVFASIDKGEYNSVFSFLKSKKVIIKNLKQLEKQGGLDAKRGRGQRMNYAEGNSDDDDAYMRQIEMARQEGEARVSYSFRPPAKYSGASVWGG